MITTSYSPSSVGVTEPADAGVGVEKSRVGNVRGLGLRWCCCRSMYSAASAKIASSNMTCGWARCRIVTNPAIISSWQ